MLGSRSCNSEARSQEVLEVVKTMVRPGSVLVSEQNAKLYSHEELCALNGYKHITIEQLAKCDRPDRAIIQILGKFTCGAAKRHLTLLHSRPRYLYHLQLFP